MMAGRKSLVFFLSLAMRTAMAQVPEVTPHVMTKADAEGTVTVVEVATHFVTAIRMPETVNSVVVGDPTQFQVEHSDREPELVFIKALTPKPAETNLLISTTRGHEVSLLVLNRGEETRATAASVDFLVKYKSAGGFLIEPDYLRVPGRPKSRDLLATVHQPELLASHCSNHAFMMARGKTLLPRFKTEVRCGRTSIGT